MNILITGGTGFLGTALVHILAGQGHHITFYSRHPKSVNKFGYENIQTIDKFEQIQTDSSFQAVINLAGAPIFAGRWSVNRKRLIRDSRIQLTESLVAAMARMQVKPDVLISGSAIGYYGNQGDTKLTEFSAVHNDFSQQLCQDWEYAARQAELLGVRVCLIRTGLVLAGDSGMLARMLPSFRLGFGGCLGNGRQWMSWIHVQDWLAIVHAMLNDASLNGAYNATAPNPVMNREFTETLAASLHRPALLPMPAKLLKLILGEMADLVLGSQRVLPQRLVEHAFTFKFPQLAGALSDILTDD